MLQRGTKLKIVIIELLYNIKIFIHAGFITSHNLDIAGTLKLGFKRNTSCKPYKYTTSMKFLRDKSSVLTGKPPIVSRSFI